MLRVLVVDHDHASLELLVATLSPGAELTACASGEQALRALRSGSFDLVVAALDLPAPDGFEVLRAIQSLSPPPSAFAIAGRDDARAVFEALQLGAREFFVRPVGTEELLGAAARIGCPASECAEGDPRYGLVGRSPAMRRLRRLVPLLARSVEPVLVLGETGAGKELLARALHHESPRSTGPFVAHDLAATPHETIERVFFGDEDHAGLLEQADGGTLFLDEVDSFPLALQARLLRAIDSGRVRRVGSTADRAVDVRVVAAGVVGPANLVAHEAFRADLYDRLRSFEVEVPPLRERAEDIPELAEHFLAELAEQAGTRTPLSEAALQMLVAYPWPGNCRELRNAVRGAALLAGEGPILPGHLPRGLQKMVTSAVAYDHPITLEAAEGQHILRTLERVGGNRSLAARLLGIDRGTLARKLRAWGLRKEKR
jgi:DNA-binding NtrC family response regulator